MVSFAASSDNRKQWCVHTAGWDLQVAYCEHTPLFPVFIPCSKENKSDHILGDVHSVRLQTHHCPHRSVEVIKTKATSKNTDSLFFSWMLPFLVLLATSSVHLWRSLEQREEGVQCSLVPTSNCSMKSGKLVDYSENKARVGSTHTVTRPGHRKNNSLVSSIIYITITIA